MASAAASVIVLTARAIGSVEGAGEAVSSTAHRGRKNHSAFGSKRERAVKQLLEAEGWVVFHNKASKGCCDLVASRAEYAPLPGWDRLSVAQGADRLLVEVKGTTRSPWVAWGPTERAELVDAAKRAGAVPMLAWWPPHGELQWIGEAEWPG